MFSEEAVTAEDNELNELKAKAELVKQVAMEKAENDMTEMERAVRNTEERVKFLGLNLGFWIIWVMRKELDLNL